MDRKNKVWLIVLIILLILAVAGMVVSRNQLADSQAQTAAVNAQLEEAKNSSAALQSDLDAAQSALTESQTQLESLASDLAAEQDKVAALESVPAELEARIAQLEAALADAETRIAQLNSAAVSADNQPATDNQPEADAQPAIVHVTEATEWRSAPGEEGQSLADLNAGDELNYMNQTATDAQDNEWYCAELNGQTGWISADSAEVTPDPETAPAADEGTEPAGFAADVDAISQQLTAITDSEATDEEKLAEITALEEQLTQTLANLTQVSAELEAQSAALVDAEAALNAKAAELEAANAAIAQLETQIAELTAQTEAESAARAELETQLAAAQEVSAALETELAAARAEYEKHIAEVNAYLLSRDLIDGEAHVATSAAREITVEADGMTAAFNYTNNSVSGNTVVLSIVKDDAEIYCSEPIAPGESVTEIAFAEALTAGAHDAIAVTTVYNDDGSVQFASRVPVTLNVAE